MGAKCSCFQDTTEGEKFGETDKNIMVLERSPVLRQSYESPNKPNSFNVIVEVDFDIDQIVWIQSILRGFIERHKAKKHYRKINVSFRRENRKNNTSSSKRTSMDIKAAAREIIELSLDNVPEYLTQAAKVLQSQLGPYTVQMKSEKGLKKRGPVMLENRSVYTGTWNNLDQRHGRGVQTCSDGSIYEGYWKHDMYNGKGRLIKYNGDFYEGDWKDDLFQGYGVYKLKDGSFYEGEWRYGLKYGQGTETIHQVSVYKGRFYNDEMSGDGKLTFANGNLFEGNFANGKFEGFGKFVWNDGRCFEGDWTDGKMHGRGIFKWPDGRVYDGEYETDRKHGLGTFTWPDGRVYEGEWRNDKQDGEGIYTTSIGTKKGVWKNGKRVNE